MMFFSLSFLSELITLFSDLTRPLSVDRTLWKTSGGSASNLTGLPSSSLSHLLLDELERDLVDLGPRDHRDVLELVDRARTVREQGDVDLRLVLCQTEPLEPERDVTDFVSETT